MRMRATHRPPRPTTSRSTGTGKSGSPISFVKKDTTSTIPCARRRRNGQPRQRPHGSNPRLAQRSPAASCWAEKALLRAKTGGQAIQQGLDAAFIAWCQTAEVEVSDATGTVPKKWGLRGKRANVQWGSVLPETSPKGGPSRAAIATWLRGTTTELCRIASVVEAAAGQGLFADDAAARSYMPHGATFAAPVRGDTGPQVTPADSPPPRAADLDRPSASQHAPK